MSETVHTIGELDKVHRHFKITLEDQMKSILVDNGYLLSNIPDDWSVEKYFKEIFYGEYFIIKGNIYKLAKTEDIDPYDDIFRAVEIDDDTIQFELRYHNGGCGQGEAIEYALEGYRND